MSSFVKNHYIVLLQENGEIILAPEALLYQKNHPFKLFCNNNNDETNNVAEILSNINKEIIIILDAIKDDKKAMPIDRAFAQILVLIQYTNKELNESNESNESNSSGWTLYYQEYLKILIYLILSCLGEECRKNIIIDRIYDIDYKNNEALKYIVDEYLQNIKKRHIKFLDTPYRDLIINSIQKYFENNLDEKSAELGIATLIEGYVEYEYEDFYCFLVFFFVAIFSTSDIQLIQLRHQWRSLFFNGTIGAAHSDILTEILLNNKFININDDCHEQLRYQANVYSFMRCYCFKEEKADFINTWFNRNKSIQCYTKPRDWIELFEVNIFIKDRKYLIQEVISKCVLNDHEEYPLQIFKNGQNNNYSYIHVYDDKHYNEMTDNIDDIFTYIIVEYFKYFKNNNNLMMNLLYQSYNSLIYYIQTIATQTRNNCPSIAKDKLIIKFINYIKKYFYNNRNNMNLINYYQNEKYAKAENYFCTLLTINKKYQNAWYSVSSSLPNNSKHSTKYNNNNKT